MLFCSQLLGPEFEKPNKIALLLNLLQLPPSHPNADTLARSGPGTEKMKIQEGSAWATTEGAVSRQKSPDSSQQPEASSQKSADSTQKSADSSQKSADSSQNPEASSKKSAASSHQPHENFKANQVDALLKPYVHLSEKEKEDLQLQSVLQVMAMANNLMATHFPSHVPGTSPFTVPVPGPSPFTVLGPGPSPFTGPGPGTDPGPGTGAATVCKPASPRLPLDENSIKIRSSSTAPLHTAEQEEEEDEEGDPEDEDDDDDVVPKVGELCVGLCGVKTQRKDNIKLKGSLFCYIALVTSVEAVESNSGAPDDKFDVSGYFYKGKINTGLTRIKKMKKATSMFCAICSMSSEEAALAHACRLASMSAWANQLAGDEGSHMYKYSCARRRASSVTECALQQQAHSRISVMLKHVNTASSTSDGSSNNCML
eukprot:gene28809-31998_t